MLEKRNKYNHFIYFLPRIYSVVVRSIPSRPPRAPPTLACMHTTVDNFYSWMMRARVHTGYFKNACTREPINNSQLN